jgi:hypothetical protein
MGSRGRKAGATNRKRGGNTALVAGTFPRSVSWRVDQDYVEGLDDATKTWLAEFNDRYYGADFRGESEVTWSTDDRRAVYRDKNRANRDLMTCALPVEVEVPDEGVELEELLLADDGPLDDPKYKAARETYRENPSPANRVRLNQARRK